MDQETKAKAYTLLKAAYGYAFYVDGELLASWDNKEPMDHVLEQCSRHGGSSVNEVEWAKPSFPKELSKSMKDRSLKLAE